jgi:hypothetical protein
LPTPLGPTSTFSPVSSTGSLCGEKDKKPFSWRLSNSLLFMAYPFCRNAMNGPWFLPSTAAYHLSSPNPFHYSLSCAAVLPISASPHLSGPRRTVTLIRHTLVRGVPLGNTMAGIGRKGKEKGEESCRLSVVGCQLRICVNLDIAVLRSRLSDPRTKKQLLVPSLTVLTRSHKATEFSGGSRIGLVRVLVSLCEKGRCAVHTLHV